MHPLKIIIHPIIFIIQITTAGIAQSKNTLQIVSNLEKVNSFSDSTRKKILKKCKEWNLNKENLLYIHSKAEKISSIEYGHWYSWLPCYYKSQVLYNGERFTMEVNAAAKIVLYNKDTALYYGCNVPSLRKYFILLPKLED